MAQLILDLGTAVVGVSAALRVADIDGDGNLLCDALLLSSIPNPGASVPTATIILERATVPKVLITPDGTDWKFRSRADIDTASALQAQTDGLAADANYRAAAAVREARTAARKMLAARKIQVHLAGTGDGTFFGVRTFAAGVLHATATVLPDALLNPGEPATAPVLDLRAEGQGVLTLIGGITTIQFGLRVFLNRGAALACIPSVEIEPLSGWVPIELHWPAFPDFGSKLTFDGLRVAALRRLLRIDIPPLLSDTSDFPLDIDWGATPPEARITLAGGDLTIKSVKKGNGVLFWKASDGQRFDLANITGLEYEFGNQSSTLLGRVSATAGVPNRTLPEIPSTALGASPLMVESDAPTLDIKFTGDVLLQDLAQNTLALALELRMERLRVAARSDPGIFLTLSVTYVATFDAHGRVTGRLDRITVNEPYPLKLIVAAGDAAIGSVVRLLAAIQLPYPFISPGVSLGDPRPLLRRLGELVAAVAAWAAELAGEAGRSLLGLAKTMVDVIGHAVEALGTAAANVAEHLAVEVRLDSRTWKVVQLAVRRVGSADFRTKTFGFVIDIPAGWEPSLVIDFRDAPVVALVCTPGGGAAKIATDLWLARPSGAPEPIQDTEAQSGQRAVDPLIALTLGAGVPDVAIALIAMVDGEAQFLRKVRSPVRHENVNVGGSTVNVSVVEGPLSLFPADALTVGTGANDDLTVHIALAPDADKRLLPFLTVPKDDSIPSTGGFMEGLSQYVKLKHFDASKVQVKGRTASLPIDIELVLAEQKIDVALLLAMDLQTLKASLTAGDSFAIKGKREPKPKPFLGMEMQIIPKSAADVEPNGDFEQLVLDLRGGDFRLGLSPKARMKLAYRRIAGKGEGLVLQVSHFSVGRGGIDLDATADPDVPVHLAGVDVPFRFTSGGVSVRRGRIAGFQIAGAGQLPPQLLGEANVTVAIAFAPRGDDLTLQSASAVLDKGDDPIECKTTRFVFKLSKIELNGRDFGSDGIHFWFALTGSARFAPNRGEFDDGMLKYLSELEMMFDKAPLAGDPRVLMRHLDFHIAVRMKRAVNFFNIFRFELRGLGFHSRVPRFGGSSAIAISGQVDLSGGMDSVSESIEIHKLWVAEPEPNRSLPRFALDGMGFSTPLGGAGVLEGTAAAIDGTLPSLDKSAELPPEITPKGFLASGRLRLNGWAPMAASAGFLELRGAKEIRHAFFAFAQQEDLSIEIPTPIGSLYVRELGFGFGFRYTFASLVAADRVRSPDQLVPVLDEVSKRQGDLARFEAWAPEADGDRLTLAMRALFTVSSISKSGEIAPQEQFLANPILFDVAAALRSDFTFMMTARAWLATNYWTWARAEKSVRDDIRRRPGLRGYLYISAPKQMLLGRIIADPKGYIGENPKLHPQLRRAIESTTWSSTVYIRPGLFHMEFGWPYELGFEWKEKNFGITCNGGLIFRIEDGAALYGIAFRAVGFAEFGGSVGGRSFGASVAARADFSISAKMISYLSLKKVSDTFFYGSLDFAVTVKVGVHIWLEIDLGVSKFTLDIDLSFSFSISVGLELAAGPDLLAGRGAATVAVCGFGRTLGVGIAFGFNENQLADARQRVERFLALGLEATVPDPAKGLEQPQPVLPPSAAKEAVDSAVKNTDEVRDALTSATPETVKGDAIGAPSFWAVLFPIAGTNNQYVMTLIPRDCTETGAQLPMPDGTFYPPPPDPDNLTNRVDYQYDGAIALRRLTACGEIMQGPGSVFTADHMATIATKNGVDVQLWHYLASCFLCADMSQALRSDLSQPPMYPIRSDDAPRGSEGTSELRDAGAQQVIGDATTKASKTVEERRASLIASVGESAASLASKATVDAAGKVTWPTRAAAGFDARDLGLTFVVDDNDLASLFQPSTDTPRLANFTVRTNLTRKFAVDWSTAPRSPIHLLNPPERFFERAKPALAPPLGRENLVAELANNRILLDWDLEPSWGTSCGVFNDPEFLLRHYRVERSILDGDSRTAIPAKRLSFKAAAPIQTKVEGGLAYIERLRPLAQLVDEFQDLCSEYPDLRKALLHIDEGAETALDAFNRLHVERMRIVYTIVPVDLAGTHAPRQVIEYLPEMPPARQIALAKAEVLFRYPKLAGVDAGVAPQIFVRIDDPRARRRTAIASLPQHAHDGSRYRLKFRREKGLPGGLFGADALTQAAQRPGSAEFAAGALDDLVLDIRIVHPEDVLAKPDYPFMKWDESDKFQPLPLLDAPAAASTPLLGRACFVIEGSNPKRSLAKLYTYLGAQPEMGDTNGRFAREVHGVRAAAQRLSIVDPTDKPRPEGEPIREVSQSPWAAMDMALLVDATADVRPEEPIETAVECFEHPRAVAFDALAFEDLDGEAGAVQVLAPAGDGDLNQLLACTDPAATLRRSADRLQRTATRLTWNSRPAASLAAPPGCVAPAHFPALIGGFHVFEADLTGLREHADVADAATHTARVQLLGGKRGLEPAAIEDFGKIEAYYPSDTLRSGDQEERAAWYSSAETFLAWPDWGLRRFVAPAPDQSLVMGLFAGASPYRLRVGLISKWFEDQNEANASFVDLRSLQPQFMASAVKSGFAEFQVLENGEIVKFTPSTATELLRSLVWVPNASFGGGVEQGYANVNALFRGEHSTKRLAAGALEQALLQVDAILANGKPCLDDARKKVAVQLDTELNPANHPFLADVVDHLRWDKEARRYEVVLEPAPPTKAKTYTSLMDEHPEQRDPYGWAVLRTLGLAAGLKLFDMEAGEFTAPKETLERVCSAVSTVRRQYTSDTGTFLASPFVDILTRPNALHTLYSFDSAPPAQVTTDQARTLVEDQALCLVQVSLRPQPELLSADIDKGIAAYLLAPQGSMVVQAKDVLGALFYSGAAKANGTQLDLMNPLTYHDSLVGMVVTICSGDGRGEARTIVAHAKGSTKLEIDSAWTVALDGKSQFVIGEANAVMEGAMVHAIDVASGLAGGKPTLLKREVDRPQDSSLNGTEQGVESVKLPPSMGQTPALLRVVVAGERGTLKRIVDRSGMQLVAAPRVQSQGTHPEPFERFERLSGATLATLVGTPRSVAQALAWQLAWIIARRFPGFTLATSEGAIDASTLERLAQFHARFTTRGAGGQGANAAVPFSLGTVMRPDPWREEATAGGRISIVLLHKNGFATRKRFVVVPYGRYQNIEAALDPRIEAQAKSLRALGALLQDPKHKDADFSRRSADITLARSEPVRPPVVLSAGRIDVEASKGSQRTRRRREGRVLEFVLARHPEEVISESNRQVADLLQFDHVGISYWREFAAPRWAKLLLEIRLGQPAVPDMLDALIGAGFGNGSYPDAERVSFAPTSYSECDVAGEPTPVTRLPQRVPGGWRGIQVLRTRDVPFYYRVHALAYAAAGVVVSDPVTATIPEGRAVPKLPWIQDQAVPKPAWTIVTNPAGDEISLVVRWRLLALFDSVPKQDRKLWFADGTPEVAHLADPAAFYDVAVESRAGAGTRTVVAEAMPLPLGKQMPNAPETRARYLLKRAGAEFMPDTRGVGGAVPVQVGGDEAYIEPLHLPGVTSSQWELVLPLARTHPPDKPIDDVPYLPWVDANALAALRITTGWRVWRDYAPKAMGAVLRLDRPPPPPVPPLPPGVPVPVLSPQWQLLQAEVATAVTFYESVDAIAAAGILVELKRVAAVNDAVWAGLGGGATVALPIASWPAGMPTHASNLLRTDAGRLTVWNWPKSVASSARKRRELEQVFAVFSPPSQAVGLEVRKALAAIRIAEATSHDRQRVDGFESAQLGFVVNMALAAQLAPPFELIMKTRVTVPAAPTAADRDALAAVLDALEKTTVLGAGAALSAMAVLETGASLSVVFDVPHTLARDPAVDQELKKAKTAVDWNEFEAVGVAVRRPPTDGEVRAFLLLIGANNPTTQEVHAALIEQVLGPSRLLTLSIYRGFAEPLRSEIARSWS